MLVPLEFDTEWESLEESDEDLDSDNDTNDKSYLLTETFPHHLYGKGRYQSSATSTSSDFGSMSNEEYIRIFNKSLIDLKIPEDFIKLLSLTKKDEIIAKLISPPQYEDSKYYDKGQSLVVNKRNRNIISTSPLKKSAEFNYNRSSHANDSFTSKKSRPPKSKTNLNINDKNSITVKSPIEKDIHSLFDRGFVSNIQVKTPYGCGRLMTEKIVKMKLSSCSDFSIVPVRYLYSRHPFVN